MHVSTLTIALLQLRAHGSDQAANLAKGEAFTRRAAAMGADVALFPEMWNIGYRDFERAGPDAAARWQAQAVGPDDTFVTRHRELARELGIAIAVTYLERWPGAPRNTVSLIDRRGEIVLTYAKVHTCAFEDGLECYCTPGDGFHVRDLDTAAGVVRAGAMICYDREFPESARVLMLQGAEIVLTPNACTLDTHRLGQFRARAWENTLGVAMANYAAPDQNGHSVAYHPMAFDAEERPRDTLVVEAGEDEGIWLAPFDLAALRAWREREPFFRTLRRPEQYVTIGMRDA
jgi:predicted amidohydrolase